MLLNDADLHALNESELFKPLGDAHVRTIAEIATVSVVPPGEVLMKQGEWSEMYAIVDGMLRAEVQTLAGPYAIVISAPEVCGWPALVYPYTQIATISTATECWLITLPVQALRALLDADESMKLAVIMQIAVLAIRQVHSAASVLNGNEPFSSVSPA